MKAQIVKNTVIVPSGVPRGGFVLKEIPGGAGPRIRCKHKWLRVINYSFQLCKTSLTTIPRIRKRFASYPRGYLLDEEDPYLVVAADKGTATFSDIANSISKQHDFWLGDAFASGGSAGYDHKKMGITARGAWNQIKRHFREIDFKSKCEITRGGHWRHEWRCVWQWSVIYSRHMKLVRQRLITGYFYRSQPNPEKSFKERRTAFQSPNSSWARL